MIFKEAWILLKQAGADWQEDKASQLGAALAFYSILSLAPLLVIAIAIAGFIFGEDAARGQLARQMEETVGGEGAQAIQTMLSHANRPATGIVATILGVVTLLFGASGVFGQLRDSLNTIWEIDPPPQKGIWPLIRDRLFPFTLVLGTGFLLLVSLLLSAMIAGVKAYASGWLPGADALWQALHVAVSFVVIALLFAMIYKFLPATKVAWRDVWLGAVITAVLFLIGKLALGLYLGMAAVGSAYGAAGSLVVLLVWIYYAAQILFFGAELTQVCAQRYGSRVIGNSWPSDVGPRHRQTPPAPLGP